LDKIRFKDQKASFNEPVDVEQFLPGEEDDRTFWTYEGSLTTPPLLESVTWIVFKRTIKLSEDQVNTYSKKSIFHEVT
jgi:carbonic anhydrase